MSELAKLFSTHYPATVMSTPRMERLAREVVTLCNNCSATNKTNDDDDKQDDDDDDQVLIYSPIEWKKFNDGTPNLKLNTKHIQHRDVIFIIDIDMNEMLPLLSALYAIPRYLARTFTIIIGYYASGTMERVEVEGEVATAKSLARLLSVTPNPQIGEPVFHIFDIHALASRFFFADTVKVALQTGIGVMQKVLDAEPDFNTIGSRAAGKYKATIVFPDDGAHKRFRIFFPEAQFDRAIFVKVRKGDERLLMPVEGEEYIHDRHLVVIDDICMSGGTLLATAEELTKRGAASVSLFATHSVFPKESWRKFLPSTRAAENKVPIRSFYTTNSNPACTDEILKHDEASKFFKVLSLASVIEKLVVSDAPTVAKTETPHASYSG